MLVTTALQPRTKFVTLIVCLKDAILSLSILLSCCVVLLLRYCYCYWYFEGPGSSVLSGAPVALLPPSPWCASPAPLPAVRSLIPRPLSGIQGHMRAILGHIGSMMAFGISYGQWYAPLAPLEGSEVWLTRIPNSGPILGNQGTPLVCKVFIGTDQVCRVYTRTMSV